MTNTSYPRPGRALAALAARVEPELNPTPGSPWQSKSLLLGLLVRWPGRSLVGRVADEATGQGRLAKPLNIESSFSYSQQTHPYLN